jgi:hypothetical protein
LVGPEKEGGGDEVRLDELKICGEDTRGEAGGKWRGQTDGAQASEATELNPVAPATGARVGCPPTEERADKETTAEASNRGLRRGARWGVVASGAGGGCAGRSGARRQGGVVGWGGTSGTGSGGKGGGGGGRGIGVVGRMIVCGRGSWTSTHLATSETAER